jgi:hypothetical protein
MSDNGSKSAGAGISFTGLLTIAFIVLKLTHVIEWSWLWVLGPIWIPFAIFCVGAVIIIIKQLIRS